MKLPQFFFFHFSDRLSGIVPNSPCCLYCWILEPTISFEPSIRSSVQVINHCLDGYTDLEMFEFSPKVLVKYFPRSIISILIHFDRQICTGSSILFMRYKKIHLKQRGNIPWILKKEVLKFILAVSGFFALFGIGYFLNQYFRFGSWHF
jgi:hypothetical protein